MRRALPIGLAVVFVGGVLVAMLTDDSVSLIAAAVGMLALAAVFPASPEARAAFGGRFPRTAVLGRRLMALRLRTVGLAVLAAVVALVLAELLESAATPDESLAEFVEARYGQDGRVGRPPLHVAAELDEEWPADDQRYTAVGVLLRYEAGILALRPDGRGGTVVELDSPAAGFRRFHDYVGEIWGPAYYAREDLPRSAMAVPDEHDVRALRRRLAAARRAQGLCYGWDVDIRSGAREGRFATPLPRGCDAFVRLTGWIDPNAGRFRKGSRGDWELAYEWNAPGRIEAASIGAIETPLIELIEGDVPQYGGGGTRAGKGLIEHIDALPLLAQDLDGVPPVPITRAAAIPPDARPAPVERSDETRRGEETWAAIPVALTRVAAIFLLIFVGLAVAAGLVVRLVRALR